MSLLQLSFLIMIWFSVLYTQWPIINFVFTFLKKNLYSGYRTVLSLQKGQGLVEYALVLVLVAVVVIVILSVLGERVQMVFIDVTCRMIAAGREWVWCQYTGTDGWLFLCGDPDNPTVCSWSPYQPPQDPPN